MIYVSSHRRLACRLLFIYLFCSLASSLKADFSFPGGSGNPVQLNFNYDGCHSNLQINVTWSLKATYKSGELGTFYQEGNQGGETITVNPGENFVNIVSGNSGDSLATYSGYVTVNSVAGEPNAPKGTLPTQGGNMSTGQTTGPCTETYADSIAGGLNTCGDELPGNVGCASIDQFGVGVTNVATGQAGVTYTNNTGGPVQMPDGTWVAPGQAYTLTQAYYSEGNTNSIWTVGINGVGTGGQEYNEGNWTFTQGTNGLWTFSQVPNSVSNEWQESAASLLSSNGGPILWSSGLNSTQVDEAGFSALANGQNVNDATMNNDSSNVVAAIAAGISNLLHNTNAPLSVQLAGSNSLSGGSSNVWVMNWPSNLVGTISNSSSGGYTNLLSTDATNELQSQFMGPWQSSTGQLSGIVSPVGGIANGIEGQLPTSMSDDSGGSEEQDIQIGNPASTVGTITIHAGTVPDTMAGWYKHLRNLVAWIIVLILIMANCKQLFEAWNKAMRTQPAMRVSFGEALLSAGTTVLVAVAAIVVVVMGCSVMFVVGVGIVTGELSFMSSGYESPGTFFGNMGWAYSWASQWVPIWVLVSALGARAFFWFTIELLLAFLQASIKIFPASS